MVRALLYLIFNRSIYTIQLEKLGMHAYAIKFSWLFTMQNVNVERDINPGCLVTHSEKDKAQKHSADKMQGELITYLEYLR